MSCDDTRTNCLHLPFFTYNSFLVFTSTSLSLTVDPCKNAICTIIGYIWDHLILHF